MYVFSRSSASSRELLLGLVEKREKDSEMENRFKAFFNGECECTYFYTDTDAWMVVLWWQWQCGTGTICVVPVGNFVPPPTLREKTNIFFVEERCVTVCM